MSSFSVHLPSIILLSCFIFSYASAEVPLDADSILKRMESAYAQVKDYQTDVEVKAYEGGGSFETKHGFALISNRLIPAWSWSTPTRAER